MICSSLLLALALYTAMPPKAAAAPEPLKNDHKSRLMQEIREHLRRSDPQRLEKLQELVWSDPCEFKRQIQSLAEQLRSRGLLEAEKSHFNNEGTEERFCKDPVLAEQLRKLRKEDPEKFHLEIRRLIEARQSSGFQTELTSICNELKQVGEMWRQSDDVDKPAALIRLRDCVSAHFDADLAAKSACAERISREAARIHENLERRQAERKILIEEMLREITGVK
jgi:hypothetical protein